MMEEPVISREVTQHPTHQIPHHYAEFGLLLSSLFLCRYCVSWAASVSLSGDVIHGIFITAESLLVLVLLP
jgi:hypothetical protein